jgi:hypothetical protein
VLVSSSLWLIYRPLKVSIFIVSLSDVTFEYTALCTLEVLSSKPSCEFGCQDMSTVFLQPSSHMQKHSLRLVHDHFLQFIIPYIVFLRLGSLESQGHIKWYQGLWEMKMHNGRRVLLVVLNLFVQIKICVVTFDTNRSATSGMQTVICWFNPEASSFYSWVSQQSSS